MNENQIRQIVRDEIGRSGDKNVFSSFNTPKHLHNGVDSPILPPTSVLGFQSMPGGSEGILTMAAGQTISTSLSSLAVSNPSQVVVFPIPVIYGYGTTSTDTVTGAIAVGAVSATLTGAWGGSTTTLSVLFDTDEIRNVLFTAGSTAITWIGGLTFAAGTTITIIGNSRFKGGDAPDGTTIIFRNDDDGVLQLWTRSEKGVIQESWAGVDLGGSGLFLYN